MNCPKCGVQLPQGTKFCGKCGAGVHSAATPSSPGPVRSWFIYVNGKNQGPYSPSEIAGMLKSGGATPETHAWKQGMDGWKKISEIKELSAPAPAKKAAAPAAQRPAAKKSAAPAAKKAVVNLQADEASDDVSIDRKAAKKYKVDRKRREAAEAASRSKQMRREKVEQAASLKVMRTRDGVPIKFYEEPYFVLPLLIVPVPVALLLLWRQGSSMGLPVAAICLLISLFFLWYSRKFGGGGKLFLSLFFIAAMGGAAFFGLNRELVPGATLDIASLPSGINQTTYESITIGMRLQYLYYMMGDPLECKVEKSVLGEMNVCLWDNEKTGEQIQVKIKNDLVTFKHYQEAKEEGL